MPHSVLIFTKKARNLRLTKNLTINREEIRFLMSHDPVVQLKPDINWEFVPKASNCA